MTAYSLRNILYSLSMAAFLLGCDNSQNQDNKAVAMNSKNMHISEKTRNALESTRDKGIIFMHHSVGGNILNGLRELAEESGVGIKIQTVRNTLISNDKVFIDITGGYNGQPKTKVDSFAEHIKGLDSNVVPDVAFMKFCYVDFNPNTNVDEIFSYYKQKIETLKNERPDIKFVHLTVPLTARINSIKDRINRLLGRQVWDDAANIKRNEFNQLLIEQYQKDPIFDLARAESTLPDGSRTSFVVDGKTYYSLASEYTQDGGHLNNLGQRRVAMEMTNFLAETFSTKSSVP